MTNSAHANTQTDADVLFYVLNSTEPSEREAFLSKLLQKIHKEQRCADVRFPSLQEAQRYDLTLWNFKPESFIPHAIENAQKASIQLHGEHISELGKDVLINVHPEFPEIHTHYQRTIEILDQSDYLVKMGRERWKIYVKAGITPTLHKLGFDN